MPVVLQERNDVHVCLALSAQHRCQPFVCPRRSPLSDLRLVVPTQAQKNKVLALFHELSLSMSAKSLQKLWRDLEREQSVGS